MIESIEYMDTIFHKPEILILDGKYGSGYIYSATNLDVMKPIQINFYSLREWFEEGCVKIVATDYQRFYMIQKTIPWKLVVEWCQCGAYTSYWDN